MTIAQEELRKDTKERPIDFLIVFGEGPVKKVFTPSELSNEQKDRWFQYKTNPLGREPNFWVIENAKILQRFSKLSRLNQRRLKISWQKNSRHALKRWGRQNALATGLALYSGIAKNAILSGGKTKPSWLKLSEEEYSKWPTEAFLMKDSIVRNFGRIYFEKFGRRIEESLILEEKATNTLENFAYSINKAPQIVNDEIKTGLLTAHHHLKRVSVLAQIFSIDLEEGAVLSAQELLRRGKLYSQYEKDIMQIVKNVDQCGDMEDLNYFEERWIKGLKDPKYLTYWFGYVAEVRHPRVIERAFRTLRQPSWNEAAKAAFSQLKLAVGDFLTEESIVNLQRKHPRKYQYLIETLRQLKEPKYRSMPPSMTA